MTASPEFASPAAAAEAACGGLGYLAALDATQLPAGEQARLLHLLEQVHALETAARTGILGGFTAAQGYQEDACYGAKSWLTTRLGVTKGAATAYLGWARRAGAHPRVLAALAAGDIWESSRPHARREWTGACFTQGCQDAADAILVASAVSGAAGRTWPGWPRRSTRGPGPLTPTTAGTGSRTGRSGWRPRSRAPGSSAAI